MKSNFLTTLALILAAVSLAVSGLTLALLPEDQTHLINDLYQENNELRTQIEELSTLVGQQQTDVVLADWNLEVLPGHPVYRRPCPIRHRHERLPGSPAGGSDCRQ